MVKASRLVRYSRLSCVGSTTRSHILSPHKKSIGWAGGAKVTSRRYYGRRKPIFYARALEDSTSSLINVGGARRSHYLRGCVCLFYRP